MGAGYNRATGYGPPEAVHDLVRPRSVVCRRWIRLQAQEGKGAVVHSRHLRASQIPRSGPLPKSHNARKYYGLNEASSAAPQKMTIATDLMTRHA